MTDNGHVAEFHQTATRQRSTIESLISEIELAIDAERDSRTEIERFVQESKAREAHLRKALSALEDKPATAPARPSRTSAWTVSDERVDFVFEQFKAWLATNPEGEHTKTALAKWMIGNGDGIANETVSRALDVLREREVVRVTGSTRGGGKTWALMPGNHDADAIQHAA